MNKLVEALEEKIALLQDEKEELEDALSRVSTKIEAYQELLAEEQGEDKPKSKSTKRTSAPKRKRGRPKKENKITKPDSQDAYDEALRTLPAGTRGTTPEEAEAAKKRFNPTPRVSGGYGGVKAGKPEDVLGTKEAPKSGVSISVGDEK